MMLRRATLGFMAAAVLAAGCGDSGDPADDRAESPAGATTTETKDQDSGKDPSKDRAKPEAQPKGTEVVAGGSEFGEMLFGADDQAIYIFELDGKGPSECYGECAAAWPPVFTKGDPVAGQGVDQELLGTTKRDDGKLQVTYDGKPLYYYAHEAPGEVRCHNVNLNGGFWWVVGPDGKRLQ